MNTRQMIVIALLAVVLAACGTQETAGTNADDSNREAMAQTDGGSDKHDNGHGSEHSNSHENDAPYDAQFIDGMIVHHQGALTMAEQALKESQMPQIKQLAQSMIATQHAEVEQMTSWRKQWYPELPTSSGTGHDMGDMEISRDTSIPFDQRFIVSMISHHQAAVEMAKEAQTKAEHAELKRLAGEIIQAQEAEIKQLQAWQTAWFGQ
jgi:uncharacterized protein (DUF305 family)